MRGLALYGARGGSRDSGDRGVKKPRICGGQILRDNVEAESPEDYFRKSITVPFLYCTLKEMKTRFTDLHARTAPPHILGFLTSMSSGSHILALLSKHWWLNCSTFGLQSSEL
jgi:hypothetical protein